MTHTIRVVPGQPGMPDNPGLDSLGQLSGMIGQAASMAGGGVALPGLNSLGSSISSLASTFTGGAGGSSASAIVTAGTAMASSNMAGMAGLVSTMQSALSSLTSALGAGSFSQAQHTHVLDAAKGILSSAFQGQHKTTWDQNGVTHSSSSNVTSTAPMLPHNGNTLMSDLLNVTKPISAPAFNVVSDERIKSNIADYASPLDRLMQARVRTFDKHLVAVDADGIGSLHPDAPKPSFGFIAQEIQEIFPELVTEDGITAFLTVEEGKVGIIALAALQEFVIEQRREIAELKRQLKEKA